MPISYIPTWPMHLASNGCLSDTTYPALPQVYLRNHVCYAALTSQESIPELDNNSVQSTGLMGHILSDVLPQGVWDVLYLPGISNSS